MSRTRLLLAGGLLALLAACVLPCSAFLQFATVPYPDPTPELAQQQAAEDAAFERALAVRLTVGAVLAVSGIAACGYAVWSGRRHRDDSGPSRRKSG